MFFSRGNKGSVLSVFSRWHRLGGVTKADIGESQVDRTQPGALQGVALLYKTCFGITTPSLHTPFLGNLAKVHTKLLLSNSLDAWLVCCGLAQN